MELNNVVQIINNTQILEIIFSHMKFHELKNIRLVSRLWSIEALRGFKNQILIHHNPVLLKKTNPMKITKFLLQHEISFGLTTSFLDYPWHYSEPPKDIERFKALLFEKYLKQQNNIKYLQVLFTSFLSNTTAVYIKELRIELNIFHENDSDLFVNTLSKTVNLEVLAIDFTRIKKAEVMLLPEELLVPLNKLKLLGLRNYEIYGVNSDVSEELDVKCWMKILGLFPKIKFLDLTSWEQYYTSSHENLRVDRCREALQILHLEKQYFQFLEGWRFDQDFMNSIERLNDLSPFPQRLKYLVIHRTEKEEETLLHCLSYHSPNLRRCELYLNINNAEFHKEFNINLSSLPVLECLGLCMTMYLGDEENFDIEKLDILNIRKIILDGAESFKLTFPKLHTLKIAVSTYLDMDKEFFNYIFPKEVQTQIHGINSLGISLRADCESEEITRFYTMFPDLEIFKHVHEDIHNSVICVHKKDYYTKKFFLLENSLQKIIKCSIPIELDYPYINIIYHLLRGSFYKEPFFWKIQHVNWYLYPPEEQSLKSETKRRNCSLS